jgi:uncharacterized protein
MKRYLLDVSSLLALCIVRHQFHDRVLRWIQSESDCVLLTCPITEIGFVRIASQASSYAYSVPRAKQLLVELKTRSSLRVEFVADSNDALMLPVWVKTSSQVTDGHLAQLALRHRALLATLDEGIADACVIPQ